MLISVYNVRCIFRSCMDLFSYSVHSSCPDYRQWGHRSSYFTQTELSHKWCVIDVSSLPSGWFMKWLSTPNLILSPHVARYIRHEIFILWCHFLQFPLEIGCASAERVGQGEVDGCLEKAWPCLSSTSETPWLAPGRPFLSYYAQMNR